MRRDILQLIFNHPGITRREMQGRNLTRIPHHLMGLLNDGIITRRRGTRGGAHQYHLTAKGHQLIGHKKTVKGVTSTLHS